MDYGARKTDTPRRGPGRRRLTRAIGVALMAGIALGAAACSSKNASTTTTTTAASTTTVNAAAAQTDIATAFATVFNLSDPSLAPKLTAIQNGDTIQTAFGQALSSSLAKSAAGAKIDSVKIDTAAECAKVPVPTPCAHVVYDITGPTGTAVLANSQGYAVDVNGQWLVAKTTICGLLGLFYQAEGNTGSPTGC